MFPYFFIFVIIAVFSISDHAAEFRKYRIFFYFSLTILLICFAGFRNVGVGADDPSYAFMYMSIPDITHWFNGDYIYNYKSTWMEPGFIAFSAVLKIISSDYQILFFSCAILSIGIASFLYYRYTPESFLSLLLFFVHTFLYRDINQMRAAIAAALGLFLISQLEKREIKKGFLIICLCGLFHSASLSLFLPYFMSFFKITRLKIFFLVLLGLIMGGIGISHILMGILPDEGVLTEKIVGYANSDEANTVYLFDLTNIKNIFILLILCLFWARLSEKVPYFKTMMLFMSLSVFWRLAFSDFGIIAGRISTFFGIVEVILIPSLLVVFKQKLIIRFLIILYAFIVLYLNIFVKTGRFLYELSFSIV